MSINVNAPESTLAKTKYMHILYVYMVCVSGNVFMTIYAKYA